MRFCSIRSRNDARERKVVNSYRVKVLNLFYRSLDKNKGKNAEWLF